MNREKTQEYGQRKLKGEKSGKKETQMREK
jgi:hypothetical protein